MQYNPLLRSSNPEALTQPKHQEFSLQSTRPVPIQNGCGRLNVDLFFLNLMSVNDEFLKCNGFCEIISLGSVPKRFRRLGSDATQALKSIRYAP